MRSETDIAIIGTGPAGMAAARGAAAHGAHVTIVDEQAEPGGQIYKAIETVRRTRPADLTFLGKAYADGAAAVDAFRAVPTDYRASATVWHIGQTERGCRDVIYSAGGRAFRLSARYLVIATGALERPVPVPGWTLPGVLSAGAVQSALKSSGVYPSGRFVLAGSGPLMLQLAAQLVAARIPVSAIVDTAPPGGLSRTIWHLPRALLAPDYLCKGWVLLRAVRRSGVPVYHGASHLAVTGRNQATGVAFQAQGRAWRLEADVVALHEGVIPNTQLTRLIGSAHQWDHRQRAFRPVTGQWGETSFPDVHVAGDGGGIAGAAAAERSGLIVGTRLAQLLGLIGESERDLTVEELRLRRLADLNIRPFLDSLYPAPDWGGMIGDDVVVCRCEEITARQIRAAVTEGASGPNQVKAFLRCGMGPCQGRMCASTVTDVISAAGNRSPATVGSYHVRPPIKPVSLGEVAALETI